MTKNITDRLNNAASLEKNEDASSALNEYVSIIERDSANREACLNLGSLYFRLKRYRDAENFFLKAISIDEEYSAYYNLGSLYYRMGEYKKSVLNLEKSRRLNVSFYLASLVMGLSYSRMNNIKAAETNFLNVLKSDKENRVAITALAIIYYNEGRLDEALNFLERITDKENLKINEFKANILYRSGKITETADEIKGIARLSDGYRYYDNFIKSIPVEVYSDKYGDIDQKIELLKEKAVNDRDSLISLSLCHLLKGETETAIDYLFEAKKRSLD